MPMSATVLLRSLSQKEDDQKISALTVLPWRGGGEAKQGHDVEGPRHIGTLQNGGTNPPPLASASLQHSNMKGARHKGPAVWIPNPL
jgi:hypothetical protein